MFNSQLKPTCVSHGHTHIRKTHTDTHTYKHTHTDTDMLILFLQFHQYFSPQHSCAFSEGNAFSTRLLLQPD